MATDPLSLTAFPRAHRAAQRSRRMAGIYRTGRSATSINISDGRELESVVNDMMRNVPWVESYLSGWVSHTVGTGISPYFAASDATERGELRRWFARWAQETDADGMVSLHGQAAQVSRAVAKDGEVFARLRPRRLTDGFETPLQIQLIPAVQVPRDKTDGGRDGNTVIGGIERNPLGQRVAYHVYRQHPGETATFTDPASSEIVRVPADQMLHIGLPQDVGEQRHVSILRSALLTMKGMSDTNDNTIERLRVASLFTALFSNPLDLNQESDDFSAEDPNAMGVANTYGFEAGMITEMPPGASVFFPEPPDVGNTYVDFIMTQLENCAAMLGITVAELSGNYSKTNFSSLRAAIIHARRRHDQFVQFCLIDQWLMPIVRAGLRAAVIAGAINLPTYYEDPLEYDRVIWRGQRHQYLDPQTEATADAQRLEAKTISLSDVVEGDFEEHCQKLADDKATLERYGLEVLAPEPVAVGGFGGDDDEGDGDEEDEGDEED